MRTLQLLGIVLFRFRMIARLWAILLMLVNGVSLLFITTWYGQVCLAAAAAAVIVMAVIHARLGFVRLLGVGHLFWIPMLILFTLNLPDSSQQPLLYWWVISLLVCNSISLLIDSIDVVRFIRGERQPHYTWALRDAG